MTSKKSISILFFGHKDWYLLRAIPYDCPGCVRDKQYTSRKS
jgi:hypothetical protein